MATTQTLDSKLAELKTDIDNVLVLQKMSRDQERMVMASVYMWWRDALQQGDYLEQCYASANIRNNKTREANFRPLLKLVTSSRIASGDEDTWTKALRAVDADFSQNLAHYAVDPVDRICHFIKTNGGKTGLAYHGKIEVDEDEAVEAIGLYTLDDSELLATLKAEARIHYAKGAANIQLPALQLNDDGYSVVIVKKQGAGYALVGTTNETKLLDAALVSTYRSDFEALPLTMRVVLEPLHMLNIPNCLASSYAKFIEVSNLADAWDPKRRKEKAYKRLTYRAAEQDFLLSTMQVDSSVVVKARPKSNVMVRKQGDMFLPNSTRQSVEVRLLHQGAFNLFKPSSADKFTSVGRRYIAANYVDLTTKVAVDDVEGVTAQEVVANTANLSHPPLSFVPFHTAFGEPRWQVVNKTQRMKPAWQADVDLDWLRQTSTAFLDKWIAAYGKKANRQVNKTLSVALDAQGLTIAYEFDDALGYDNIKSIALPTNAAQGHVELVMRSADFAFILRQMADLNVVGAIKMQADTDGLVLSFSTTASEYEVWIAACDEKGNRCSTHFMTYRPEETEGLEFHVEPEDDAPDVTAQDLEVMRTNIERVKNAKR
jgi:hypothetical protein